MGCGQSKIGNIYSKNKKNKSNHSKKSNDPIRSTSIDQKNGNSKNNKANNNGVEVNFNEDQSRPIDNRNLPKKKVSGSGNGPLLHQAGVSASQVDFFRMLDEKIENGPDYDENVDSHRKTRNLSHHWDLESILWTDITNQSNASPLIATTTAVTTTTTATTTKTEMSASAIDESCNRAIIPKDRETIRNIISSRSDIAPVFTRSANCVDGLQKSVSPPSTNMPRHVLESISQSPTRIWKYSAPFDTPSDYSHQYDDCVDEKDLIMMKAVTSTKMNCQSQWNDDDDDDNAAEDSCVFAQALHREQYLQQSGIISVQSQYQPNNIIRHNTFIQQFQTANSESHFETSNSLSSKTIKMT